MICASYQTVVDPSGAAFTDEMLIQHPCSTPPLSTDLILMTYTEIQSLGTSVAGTPVTLQDLFAMPVAADLQQAFYLGFGLPVLTYLVSSAYGMAINWFSRETDS
jgi:hypothetical protein